MTIPAIPRSDFYVYALFREDGVTPFYIGKGLGTRIRVHERSAHRFTSHKDWIIRKMIAAGITDIPKTKLAENLTDDAAKQIEMDLIQLIGRWPLGPLANLTNGGDGVLDLSPEARAKQSAANVRSWADPEIRARRSAGIKAALTHERLVEMVKIRQANMPPEQKARIAARKARKIVRAAEMAIRRAAKLERQKNRGAPKKSTAAQLNTPEAIAKRIVTGLLPEVRARRVAAQKAAFSTPEAKAKRSAASIKMWAAKRAQNALPSPKANDPDQPPPQHPMSPAEL